MARRASRQVVVGMAAAGFIAGVMVVGAFVPAPGPGVAASQDTAYLRVVHAAPGAPPLDVAVADETVLSAAGFGEIGPYRTLPAGTHAISVSSTDDDTTVVVPETVTLARGSVTTLAVASEATATGTTVESRHVYADDAQTPGTNESAVRVVHLSPDSGAVAVTAADGSVDLAGNVSFGGASPYVTIPAGEYRVEVREETESGDALVETATVSLDGGEAQSVLALGYAAPAEAPVAEPVTLLVVADASTTLRLPDEGDPSR